jgi:hypothetical protein
MPRARIIRSSAAFRRADAIRLRKKGAIRSSNWFIRLRQVACVRRRGASRHRLDVRHIGNDAKDGLCLCDSAALRRQAGVTAVRARKRIVEFVHAGPRQSMAVMRNELAAAKARIEEMRRERVAFRFGSESKRQDAKPKTEKPPLPPDEELRSMKRAACSRLGRPTKTRRDAAIRNPDVQTLGALVLGARGGDESRHFGSM